MAMERVDALMNSAEYDLIVLDTPPSDRVLEFFDAPSRMTEIMDSPLTKILSQGARLGGKALVPWIEGGMRRLVRKVGQVTSSSMLEEIGALMASLAEMFGGFSERARRVDALFRSESFRPILVTTPAAIRGDRMNGFLNDLEARGVAVDAILLNRVRTYPTYDWGSTERRELEAALGLPMVERLYAFACDEAEQVSLDRQRVAEVKRNLANVPSFVLPSLGPELSGPEHLLALFRADPAAP